MSGEDDCTPRTPLTITFPRPVEWVEEDDGAVTWFDTTRSVEWEDDPTEFANA